MFETITSKLKLTNLHCRNGRFDIERLREVTRMFLGLHDFRTFMSVSRQQSPTRDHPRYTVRTIDEIIVKPGKSSAIGANAELAENIYDYWEIEFKAKAFLYKQVSVILFNFNNKVITVILI